MSKEQKLKEVLERRRQWGKTRDSDFVWLIQQAEKAERYERFHAYYEGLYEQGLGVSNWHLNGDIEPFDRFFEAAEEEMKGAKGDE
ncbi:hypothetical protein DH09_08350 [Bacillaceae bacterium JMAK1]|nr:hypothetical protein DH09_08350 [Bacillaceae bacterium JMAK1]